MEICNVDFLYNVMMVSLLFVHAKRIGWKIRPRPKIVILKIKIIQMTRPPWPCGKTHASKAADRGSLPALPGHITPMT